jgi:hypothetical protein
VTVGVGDADGRRAVKQGADAMRGFSPLRSQRSRRASPFELVLASMRALPSRSANLSAARPLESKSTVIRSFPSRSQNPSPATGRVGAVDDARLTIIVLDRQLPQLQVSLSARGARAGDGDTH